MKKSLSLLLAIAMVFSMFSSLAFAADAELTAQQKYDALAAKGIFAGINGEAALDQTMNRAQFARVAALILGLEGIGSTDTKVVTEKPFSDVELGTWYVEEIAAAKEAKVFVGNADGTFNPKGDISVQELAVVVAGLLGLEEVKDATVEGAAPWAAGFIQALLNAKVDFPTNYTEAALRSDLASLAFQADAKINPVVPVVTTATKVASVSASNLKEVAVAFDGEVDKASAENADNYTLESGAVDSVALSADSKSVTLTLTGVLVNQEPNKLTVKGVKAGTVTVEAKDVAFTPLDNTLATIVSVTALGNKAIKVVYDEPIELSNSLNYKLDGKAFYGSSTQGSREIVLTPYDSGVLTAAEHTLVSEGAQDYRGLKTASQENKFAVVEDKEAPTMTNVEATLEKVTITFSEDIDPSTLSNDKVYWLSGTTEKKAISNKKIAGNKYEFDFTGVALPAYETTLYVKGVKDYSNNAMTADTIAVKATVDQTRPEVVEIKAINNNNDIQVKFSKKVKGVSESNFTVTDKDGKVRSVSGTNVSEGTTFVVSMYSALPEGTNTVKISGIKDATTLENSMLDYTGTIVLGDKSDPTLSGVSSNEASRQVVVTFNEKMDVSTLADRNNYLVTYNSVVQVLPSNVQITIVQDGKGVLLIFPARTNDAATTFGGSGLTDLKVLAVKDVAGNILGNFKDGTNNLTIDAVDSTFATDYNAADYGTGIYAIVTDRKTVKVKFDRAIASDSTKLGVTLSVYGGSAVVDKITADGSDVVVIKTVDEMDTDATPAITIAVTNGLKTVTGSVVDAQTILSSEVLDKVAPVVAAGQTTYAVSGTKILVAFSEALAGDDTDGTGVDTFYANDLVVTRVTDSAVLKANSDFTTNLSADGKTLEITITKSGAASKFTVEFKGVKYIQDLSAKANTAGDKGAVSTTSTILVP